MKWVIVVATLACVLALMGQARAADTATISVTVSLESVISVTVNPSTWAIGPVSLGSTSAPVSFTASIGNTASKLEIKGTDGAGAWVLGATAGANQFAVSGTAPAITLSKTYQTLVANVAAYGSSGFNLAYSAPTSDTKGGGVDQSFTVSVKASVP